MAHKRQADAEKQLLARLMHSSGLQEVASEKEEPQPSLGNHRLGASLRTELAVLSWRALTDIRRNPALLLLHMGIGIVMGVLVGAIFRNLTPDIAGAQGRLGAIFFTLCLAALTSLTTVDLLTAERGLVVRELQAGYYRPITYYLSKGKLHLCSPSAYPTRCLLVCLTSFVQGGRQSLPAVDEHACSGGLPKATHMMHAGFTCLRCMVEHQRHWGLEFAQGTCIVWCPGSCLPAQLKAICACSEPGCHPAACAAHCDVRHPRLHHG